MTNPSVVLMEQSETEGKEQVLARVKRDGLRSIFHLMVAKPDSTQKQLSRKVIISPDAIEDLHQQVLEKLGNHRIESLVATVDVTYENNITSQFGTWVEFASHRWSGPERTKEMRIKWDFLVDVDGFEVPQRHTLSIKITSKLKPFHYMQAVFSKDPDDLENFELELCPVICRVDFVNHILSKELIALVDDWNEGLPQPDSEITWFHKIKNHKDKIVAFARHTIPVALVLFQLAILEKITEPMDITRSVNIGDIKIVMTWLILSLLTFSLGHGFGSWLVEKIHRSFEHYGRYAMFQLTNGDKQRLTELEKANIRDVRVFVFSACFSLLLNILAGIIVVKLWS